MKKNKQKRKEKKRKEEEINLPLYRVSCTRSEYNVQDKPKSANSKTIILLQKAIHWLSSLKNLPQCSLSKARVVDAQNVHKVLHLVPYGSCTVYTFRSVISSIYSLCLGIRRTVLRTWEAVVQYENCGKFWIRNRSLRLDCISSWKQQWWSNLISLCARNIDEDLNMPRDCNDNTSSYKQAADYLHKRIAPA